MGSTSKDLQTLNNSQVCCPATQYSKSFKAVCVALQWEDDHHIHNFDVTAGRISTEFFKGGTTNIAYNCLDR